MIQIRLSHALVLEESLVIWVWMVCLTASLSTETWLSLKSSESKIWLPHIDKPCLRLAWVDQHYSLLCLNSSSSMLLHSCSKVSMSTKFFYFLLMEQFMTCHKRNNSWLTFQACHVQSSLSVSVTLTLAQWKNSTAMVAYYGTIEEEQFNVILSNSLPLKMQCIEGIWLSRFSEKFPCKHASTWKISILCLKPFLRICNNLRFEKFRGTQEDWSRIFEMTLVSKTYLNT